MFKHRPDKEGIKTLELFADHITGRGFKHRPDKEGIKTMSQYRRWRASFGSNTDLIKKGLRPVAITIFKS